MIKLSHDEIFIHQTYSKSWELYFFVPNCPWLSPIAPEFWEQLGTTGRNYGQLGKMKFSAIDFLLISLIKTSGEFTNGVAISDSSAIVLLDKTLIKLFNCSVPSLLLSSRELLSWVPGHLTSSERCHMPFFRNLPLKWTFLTPWWPPKGVRPKTQYFLNI